MLNDPETTFTARTYTLTLKTVNDLHELELKTKRTKSDLVREAIELLRKTYELDPSILQKGENNDGRPRSDQISPAVGDDTKRNG